MTALLLVVLCLLCALDTGMSYAGCLFALAGVWFSALAREGLIALSVLPLPDDDRTETRS